MRMMFRFTQTEKTLITAAALTLLALLAATPAHSQEPRIQVSGCFANDEEMLQAVRKNHPDAQIGKLKQFLYLPIRPGLWTKADFIRKLCSDRRRFSIYIYEQLDWMGPHPPLRPVKPKATLGPKQ